MMKVTRAAAALNPVRMKRQILWSTTAKHLIANRWIYSVRVGRLLLWALLPHRFLFGGINLYSTDYTFNG